MVILANQTDIFLWYITLCFSSLSRKWVHLQGKCLLNALTGGEYSQRKEFAPSGSKVFKGGSHI